MDIRMRGTEFAPTSTVASPRGFGARLLFIFHFSFFTRASRGFTLLEVLIVVAILVTIAGAGVGYYRAYVKSVELSTTTKTLQNDLRYAQSRAMIGEGGLRYGAHLVNGGSGQHYYTLFSTPTTYSDGSTSVFSTTTLPLGVLFSTPANNTTLDIVFSRISGTTTPATISLISEGVTQSLTVSSLGTIY